MSLAEDKFENSDEIEVFTDTESSKSIASIYAAANLDACSLNSLSFSYSLERSSSNEDELRFLPLIFPELSIRKSEVF